MTKNILIAILSVYFWSTETMAGAPQGKANWKSFSNKFGWEIKYPSCWSTEVALSDGLKAEREPMIAIVPEKKCSKDFEGMAAYIEVSTQDKVESPNFLFDSEIKKLKESKKEFVEENISLGNKQSKVLLQIIPEGPGTTVSLAWTAHIVCGGKNLKYTLLSNVPKEKRGEPLSKQEMPEVLKKITSNFVCNKP